MGMCWVWGSCEKFWEPEGTKAFIYLYYREYLAGSKLAQNNVVVRKKNHLKGSHEDCEITARKGCIIILCEVWIKHTHHYQNKSDTETIWKAMMGNEWEILPLFKRQWCTLKQGTFFLITAVKLFICQWLVIRWDGKSTRLHWQVLNVALLLKRTPAQPTLNEERKREREKS